MPKQTEAEKMAESIAEIAVRLFGREPGRSNEFYRHDFEKLVRFQIENKVESRYWHILVVKG